MIETVRWREGTLRLIDQTRLPAEEVVLELTTVEEVLEAIGSLRVRGAPAIGIAAAYGVALAARGGGGDRAREHRAALAAAERLRTARPTAVNLAWALERMIDALDRTPGGISPADRLVAEAHRILEEDLEMSRAMGAHGAALLPEDARVLTHCNTGGLATGGLGTALGVIYAAKARGLRPIVYANETRPLLQGARLTCWECAREGIPVKLLVDGAAAWALRTEGIHAVLIGADRIARNGDVANKIGSYPLALAAREAGVPFYVVAPGTTIDPGTLAGDSIQIEERGAEEICSFAGVRAAPPGVKAYNPAFDVTPASLVTAIVTEAGIFRPPYGDLAGARGTRRATAR